jgi:hypothetical protein
MTTTTEGVIVLTPDLAAELPTGALSGLLTGLEGLGDLLAKLDDCELFVIQLEDGLHSAIHAMDAELQRRQPTVNR